MCVCVRVRVRVHAQMVSELKSQNGLLKSEKDDLNRMIQEQRQQMTGNLAPLNKFAQSEQSLQR